MPRHKKNYSRNKGKKFSKPDFKQKKSASKAGPVLKRNKNFRFIQRSKEAEEYQRRQKTIEDKYRQQLAPPAEEDETEEEAEAEEENAFETLLSSFNKNGQANKLIESSSEEESDPADDDISNSSGLEEESIDDSESLVEAENGEEKEGTVESSDIEDEENGLEDLDKEGEKGQKDYEERIEDNDEDEDELDDDCEVDDDDKINNDGTKVKMPEQDSNDQFSKHFDNELCQEHVDNLLAKPCLTKKSQLTWPKMGTLHIEISKSRKEDSIDEAVPVQKKKKILSDDEHYASEGTEPELKAAQGNDLDNFGIKQQLSKNVSSANKASFKIASDKLLTSLQAELLSIVSNYQDLSFSQRTLKNAEQIRFVYCLHALNHMLKTRAKIVHHNAKLKAASESKKASTIIPDSYRDQGLVRPRVLIVLPFRDSAFRAVNYFVDLMYGSKAEKSKTDGTVINYKRFMDEYTGDTLYFPKTNPKPEDYEKTFAGNTDDNFRIGISLTKKCIKLYTEFYSSDILIASPLGLRMIVGTAGDADRDYDFLTSIEVLILDQAELFLAQNWEHLLHVLDHMHLQPQSTRNTDFSRVRPWCLNGLGRFYRQTLLFTSHELPEFRSLFNSKCSNYRGKVRSVNPVIHGSICNVFVQTSQVFHKIDVESIECSFDRRFKYFVNEILPQFKGPSMAHCMVYVPSYFDYVRLRNYFKSETVNFVQICEYTKDAKIARARDMFFHSAAHFLLYSERAHFFRRTRIKGIRHLIFYQPPCWPHLYPELINFMQESYQNPRDGLETSMSVTVLYTKYDMLQVSALIGTDRAGKLLRANKSTHVFMAGE